MRLSDAIWLGDSMKRCRADMFLSTDGSCGCALGGAVLAAGINPDKFYREYYLTPTNFQDLPFIKHLWPWLTGRNVLDISQHYNRVEVGLMTLEQLCDYVRTIEPAEPEPENYEDAEEYWGDSDTMRELVRSIGVPK